MLIESNKEYICSLIELWNKVFGDSEEYIKLFFDKAYYDCECFAEVRDGRVVSAFYLLKCSIKFEGQVYNGRYLYAAATLPKYRGGGIMSKLIKEAIGYCKSEKLDFIALVPADDGLYDYYGRFGFIESMYKYTTEINKSSAYASNFRRITEAEEFCKIRNTASCNMLVYNKIGSDYAFECLKFSGTDILSISDNAYYAVGEELFCSDDYLYSADTLSRNAEDKISVFTNCPLQNAVKIRNGMIYNFRDDISFKDIYMNIALD